MPRWKDISTAPTDRNFLVDGGILGSELENDKIMSEPVIVEPSKNNRYYVAHAVGYAVWVLGPTHWTDIPERPLCYALRRHLEYDL